GPARVRRGEGLPGGPELLPLQAHPLDAGAARRPHRPSHRLLPLPSLRPRTAWDARPARSSRRGVRLEPVPPPDPRELRTPPPRLRDALVPPFRPQPADPPRDGLAGREDNDVRQRPTDRHSPEPAPEAARHRRRS